jgi:predicted  nucleic acid-binding Zn-ribbon protein
VSNGEADRTDGAGKGLPDEYDRLEAAVHGLLDQVSGYRARAQVAEHRASELERTLRDVNSGALDPVKMRDGMRALTDENKELRRRIVQAQDRIRRLIARFDFLREEM